MIDATNYVIVSDGSVFGTFVYDKKAEDHMVMSSVKFDCIAGDQPYLSFEFGTGTGILAAINQMKREEFVEIYEEALKKTGFRTDSKNYVSNYKKGKVWVRAQYGMWNVVLAGRENGEGFAGRFVKRIKLCIDAKEGNNYVDINLWKEGTGFTEEGDLVTETVRYDIDTFVFGEMD